MDNHEKPCMGPPRHSSLSARAACGSFQFGSLEWGQESARGTSMTIKEVAVLLGMRQQDVRQAITSGWPLPVSRQLVRLSAEYVGETPFVSEDALNTFIAEIEAEEPGRNPPADVRRQLLVECRYRCAICRSPVLRLHFHHIVEWSKLKHHHPEHMLALCGTCHDQCSGGVVDAKAQYEIKERLGSATTGIPDVPHPRVFLAEGPARFSWDDLATVISALHDTVAAPDWPRGGPHDLADVDLERKNELNRVSESLFREMRERHEPFFHRVAAFLRDPRNYRIAQVYTATADELAMKVAIAEARGLTFDAIWLEIHDAALESMPLDATLKRTLRILLSFMYFHCDIGRKR